MIDLPPLADADEEGAALDALDALEPLEPEVGGGGVALAVDALVAGCVVVDAGVSIDAPDGGCAATLVVDESAGCPSVDAVSELPPLMKTKRMMSKMPIAAATPRITGFGRRFAIGSSSLMGVLVNGDPLCRRGPPDGGTGPEIGVIGPGALGGELVIPRTPEFVIGPSGAGIAGTNGMLG